jgi:AraC-like DNA-binding protein
MPVQQLSSGGMRRERITLWPSRTGGDVKGEAAKHYHARLRRALRHIEEHLGHDLSVQALSEVAAFSKYHFHRQFMALFGIGVHHSLITRCPI